MTRHHQIHVWLNDEVYSSLVRLARENDETLATTLGRILQEHLRSQEAEASATKRGSVRVNTR